ncbi:MAG: GDSL-type esterase/lipase family protein [Kiritimatiellae bacterium]|nr:GDSL-type esterase/lipase family protein [Kiritimatiellia bacterium]
MKKSLFVVCSLVSLFAVAADLVLVGDSTLAPRTEKAKPGSWGDMLKPYLKEGNGIINAAHGGLTVRTIQKYWIKEREQIKKGDFVIFQFGINDANKAKFVDEAEFKKTMGEFVDYCRSKEATPFFASPLSDGGFRKNSKAGDEYKPAPARTVYGDYAKAVAAEKKVDFVDMARLTESEFRKVGRDTTVSYFVGDSERKDKKTGEVKKVWDMTHPNKAGARRFAEIFLADVKANKLPVSELFK